MTYLIVPGLHGSGPDHWQSRWEEDLIDARRIQLDDCDDPSRAGWVSCIAAAFSLVEGAPILLAHSLGCLAVAWWAAGAPAEASRIALALLVAPPDAERPDADGRIRRFAPVPRRPLPFPALVIASRNDPYASFDCSTALARDWSARFHDAGVVGHINADSGLGSWPDGRRMLDKLAWPCPAARTGVDI